MSQGHDGVASVAAKMRDLFPPEVSVAAVDARCLQASILPAEAPAIGGAVEARQREFAAGRAAARQAMASFGLGDQPVTMGADRAPIWPKGVVGSISHTRTYCAAVAACDDRVQSLGLDLETDTPLEAALWEEICTPEETAWLVAQPESCRGRLAKLIFSAKECAYKCQYPLTGQFLSFHDARVDFNLRDCTFEVAFTRDIMPAQANGWRGKYLRESGLLVVGMMLRQPVTGKGIERNLH
jgi:4'-phosphopantetheinyl transferase EntD